MATAEETRIAVRARRPDLAILDVRLQKDKDVDDWSGLYSASDLVETPTNYLGWLYTKMGPDRAWTKALARELRFSGINMNLKHVLSEVRSRR